MGYTNIHHATCGGGQSGVCGWYDDPYDDDEDPFEFRRNRTGDGWQMTPTVEKLNEIYRENHRD